MNTNYVTDTMALVLRLEKRRLSRKVKTIFDDVIELMVSAMVLAEIGYLSERNRIETNLNEVKDYCQKSPRFK